MSAKLLKILIYIAGAACLYAFIAIRIHPLFNAILKEKIIPEYWENTKYGELYYFNFIQEFQGEGSAGIPDTNTGLPKNPRHWITPISSSLGTVFLIFQGWRPLPEILQDTLGFKVYYARYDLPMKSLDENGFQNNKEKIFVYESAERYIPHRFTYPQPEYIPDPRSKFRQDLAKVRDFIFVPNKELLYNTPALQKLSDNRDLFLDFHF